MSSTSLVFNVLARDKASKVFDQIKGKAATAGVAIGAALSASLAVGLASGMNKSKTDALLAAQVGATPALAADLGKASGSLYAKGFGDSIEASSAAIKGVWQNSLVPEDASNAAIEAVSAKVITLSTIMGEESDKVSAAVSTMLRTGMAKSAEEAFDVLTRGTQQGINKQQDLLDTFTEYPTIFRQLGLDATTSMGLLGQAIKGGARNSDVAADALKEFAIRAQDGSKTSATAFKALGLDAAKMSNAVASGGPKASAALGQVLERLRGIEDPAHRAQVAVGLFGTKSEDMQKALLSMDLSKASTQLGDVAGAAQKAGETLTGSAGAKVDQFKRKLEMGFVETLGKAVTWIEKHNTLVVTMVKVLGPIVGIITAIVVVTKIWTAVQTALNVVMSMNPVGLIVLAIVALIAIIVLIATKTTWFQTIWEVVWGAIKTAAVATWDFLKKAFLAWWGVFSGFWTGVGRFFASLWSGIVAGVKGAWKWIKDTFTSVVTFVGSLPSKISNIGKTMWSGITNSFRGAINFLIRGWNALDFSINIRVPSWVPGIGGKGFHVNDVIPDIPYLAKGGSVTSAGLAVVGEKGPELLSLNRGAQVTPLSGSRSAGSNVLTIDLTGGDEEFKRFFRAMLRKNPNLIVRG